MIIVLFVLACEPAPIEVYEEMRAARDSKDWEAVLVHFDESSRNLFEGLEAVSEKTSRKYAHHVRLEKACTWGDVLSETIEGTRAVIEVGKERSPESIYFVMEDGSWKMRGCLLSGLWTMP